MQALVDWLYARIDPAQPEAAAHDERRGARLHPPRLHAPVNAVLAASVPRETEARIGGTVEVAADTAHARVGMHVLLYDVGKRPVHAVVEDLTDQVVVARVVHASAPSVTIAKDTRAQLGEQARLATHAAVAAGKPRLSAPTPAKKWPCTWHWRFVRCRCWLFPIPCSLFPPREHGRAPGPPGAPGRAQRPARPPGRAAAGGRAAHGHPSRGGEGGRLLLVRSLDVGRIDPAAPPSSLALAMERRMREVARDRRPGGRPRRPARLRRLLPRRGGGGGAARRAAGIRPPGGRVVLARRRPRLPRGRGDGAPASGWRCAAAAESPSGCGGRRRRCCGRRLEHGCADHRARLHRTT